MIVGLLTENGGRIVYSISSPMLASVLCIYSDLGREEPTTSKHIIAKQFKAYLLQASH